MHQSEEGFQRQLRLAYGAIVAESFSRAWWVEVSRTAATEWRKRAQHIAPVILCALWCLVGCAKVSTAPAREFSAAFDVQPAEDGQGVAWALHFSTQQYHRFLDATPNGAERESVRELIATGLEMHHMVGCSPREQSVTKLANGDIAFVGSCSMGAHAVPAGGI